MKLTHASGRLKGRRLDVALTGCDLFVGPNGSGKSSHLLLVTAGLRGLATAPTDAVRDYLGTAREGETGLTWDDGRTLRRDLSQEKGKAVVGADALATEIAGPHVVRWDLSDFTRATDSARAKLLERVCSVSGAAGEWTSARIRPRLTEWSNSHTAGIVAGLLGFLPLDVDGVGGLDAGRWIAGALTWAAATYTDANAAAKQAKQTADGMAEERAAAPKVAGSLEEARQAVGRHEADASAARSALAAAKATGTARQDHAREGDRAAEEVGAAADALTLAEETRALARQRAEGLNVEALDKVTADASAHLDRALAAFKDTQKALNGAIEAHIAAERAHTVAVGGLDTIAAVRQIGDGACHKCHTPDPLRLAAWAADAEAARLVLSDALEDAEVELMLCQRRHDTASSALDSARKSHAAAEDAGKDARRRLTDALRDVKRAEDGITAATARNERALGALAAWNERPVPAAPVDTSVADAQLAAAVDALATAKRDLEALVRQQEREAAMQRAVATREEAAAKFEAVKVLGAALKRLQAEIARDAYGPITTEANTLLAEAGSDLAVEFHDEADFGARRGEQYIHFAALSDAERATVGASLCYAFARLTKAPWRVVVLDGMEAIDDLRLPGLLGALVAAVVDERIDNVIGAFATVDELWIDTVCVEAGVTVHSLGGKQPQLALVSP